MAPMALLVEKKKTPTLRTNIVDIATTFQRLTKADFLQGVGIAVGVRDVSFVHISKRFVTVSLRHARTVPLPETGRERLDEFDHALHTFLQDIEALPDQIVLSLPRHAAYVSRLVVPESARDVISEVIGYQADQLFPFPKDDLYYDYLTLDVGHDEKRIEVTVFGFSRREVEEYLGILSQAQLRPQMVTLSCSALTSALAFCTDPMTGPRLLLVPEPDWIEIDSIGRNQLLASQIVPFSTETSKEELDELLAQVEARSFPGASLADTAIFSSTTAMLPLTMSADRDLPTVIAGRFALSEGDILPPTALPAVGAALQAVGEGVGGVNLLPEERRAQRETRFSPLTLALASAIGILGLLWVVVVTFQQHWVLRSLAQQRATLEEPVRQVQAQEEEASKLQQQLLLLEDGSRSKVIPVIKNLSELFPKEYYLNHLRYKDGDLEMSGLGSQSAADLIADLENSLCFRDVTAKAPFTTTPQGVTFTLGAKVEACKD
jgi:Tfp pilus assembly protein PilN